MSRLTPWDALPAALRTQEVRPYYQALARRPWRLFVKRLFDVLLSLLLLLPLLPLMLVLALVIRLDSPGPSVFTQQRVTKNGRLFTIYKFRTMKQDAQSKGPQVTQDGDLRITRLGRPLRALRLDELPQLINILKGDMSFVGTRPESPRYVAGYAPEYYATLLLPAGLTSRASVLYKDEARLLSRAQDADAVYLNDILPRKMRYNLQSLARFSLRDEALVLVSTGLAVVGFPVSKWLSKEEAA